MAGYTEYYNLKKPMETEYYNIEDANTNNEIIDGILHEKVDKIPNKGLSTNDFTDGYKKKIDSMQALYRFKGSIDTINGLSTIEHRNIGDVYKCKEDSNNYCWNGSDWIDLGQEIDFSNVLEKIEEFEKRINESDNLIVSSTEPTGVNRKKVWLRKGKNWFNNNDLGVLMAWQANYSIDENRKITAQCTATSGVSFIKINPVYLKAGTYTFSANITGQLQSIRVYKGDTLLTTFNSSTGTFTLEEDTSICFQFYMWVFTTNSITIQDIQVEHGEEATEYEPYTNPAIYVKNDNDIYEEFIKKDLEINNYSTEERAVGKWIDGKMLYEKTFVTTAPVVTIDGNQESENITLKEKVDTIFIVSANANNAFMLPVINYAQNRMIRIDIVKMANSTLLTIYNNAEAWSNFQVTFTVRYTKTTD